MVRPDLPDNLPDNWQDLAAGYILKNLSDEEVLQWNSLLDQHPELYDELENLQSLLSLFAETIPMHQPPDRLRERIRAAAQGLLTTGEAPQSLASQVRTSHRSGDRFKIWTGIGGTIAASAIAILGFQLLSVRSQLQQANQQIAQSNQQIASLERDLQEKRAQVQTVNPIVQTLQQPGTLVYSLEGSNLANAASGRLIMSDQQQVIILVQNLPELPAGKVYRLWADVPQEQGLLYCGQFEGNTEGIIQLTPLSSTCGANPTQMLITIDAKTDPTTRGGPVVLHGRI